MTTNKSRTRKNIAHRLTVKNNNIEKNMRIGKIYAKLTIKTPERRQLHPSSAFIVNSEHISNIFLVFPLTLNK